MQAIPAAGTGPTLLAGRGILGPRRYVISNQKGGQGKTTTTAALGAEFAAAGYSVRMIDSDPQVASLTFWFQPQWDVPPERRYDLSHVLLGQATMEQATWPTVVPGLYIVPSFTTLNQFEGLRPPGAEMILRGALDETDPPADVTLVDCPPNLGLLTVTAINSADEVLIPVMPGALDVAGVSDLYHTLEVVRKRLNPSLHVTAVILRRQHTALAAAIEQQLAADYPDAIHQLIRHTVRVGEVPNFHVSLRDYAPDATATADYRQLAERLDEDAMKKAQR
jgi:chromosome partitioning protein